jgi:hypothetical protein
MHDDAEVAADVLHLPIPAAGLFIAHTDDAASYCATNILLDVR